MNADFSFVQISDSHIATACEFDDWNPSGGHRKINA
jgi:hypothetical protein